MRQRLITAAVAIVIGVAILFFYHTIILNFAIALVVLLSLHEFFAATKFIHNKLLVGICYIFAVLVPFFHISSLKVEVELLCLLFVLALFILILIQHKTMRLSDLATAILITMLLSFSFSTIVYLRDFYSKPDLPPYLGLLYILFVLLGAWISDAGGYFVGRFFGKTKLAPEISPKKTVEGALGSLVFTLIVLVLVAVGYQTYLRGSGISIHINYTYTIILSLICPILATIGDLSASLIKRECQIKDFGNIMPGHGGILDRFDSIIFVSPFVMIFIQIFPIISKV